MWLYGRLFLVGLGMLGRRRRDLILEHLILRQQLAVWERSGRRPRLQTRDRRFWSVTARNWAGWRAHLQRVQPAPVIGWQRVVWRRYGRWKSRGGQPGRVRIDLETRRLIDRLAAENPRWGVRRIAAEFAVLGHPVSPTPVSRYRRIRPAPSPTWRTFLRLPAPEIWAADFFPVQTRTLRPVYVFFVISHARRRILHGNVTAHPTAPWVWRQIIAATPSLPDPRPGSQRRRSLRAEGGGPGDRNDLAPRASPQSQRDRGAGDWHDPARVSGPSHRAHGTASPAGAPRVRRLRQRHASPPVSGRPAAIRSADADAPWWGAAPSEPADSGRLPPCVLLGCSVMRF